ncbi:Ankyrin-2 [Dactylellina cionopaga]|nr:Ankyrin-2 [Dactylellina cionopaga]
MFHLSEAVLRGLPPLEQRVLLSQTLGQPVKFGKHLQKRQLDIPEYAASFVNYKGLKKLIKQLASSSRSIRSGTSLPLRTPEGEILNDPQAALHANKTTFFFRLDREIEKVNAFYLQKQDELTVRLRTLIEKKDAMQSRTDAAAKNSVMLVTLQEGFHQFGVDLNKLQQFVELNATGFSKILKKSRTKELYLSRAVEVQPCFNRDVISELSDRATTGLLELEAWAEGESITFNRDGFTAGTNEVQATYTDAQAELSRAIASGDITRLSETIGAIESAPGGNDILTRAFLSGIVEAPTDCLQALSKSACVDLKAKDEINERNALHEAANAGRLSIISTLLSAGVDVGQSDAYGRLPLHYAAMHGHVDILEALLIANPKTLDSMDLDNFTPLIHALHHHQLPSVEVLIKHKARIDPASDKDYIPLNLACQHGLVEIAEILLKNGAQILPDAEGLFPQHHVARRKHAPSLLVTLQSFGANLNEFDKLNGWTPMFHAASEGNTENLKILLSAGARLDLLDEKNLSALYYSAWEGHLECMKILFDAGGILGVDAIEPPVIRPSPASTQSSTHMVLDADGIPDLALPPPILPLRRYGHNFLDKKTFVQLTFTEKTSDAIFFYQQGKYPAARLTVSSKSSDVISKNMLLPLADDAKIVSFQIDSLEAFAIEFEIFPTFGTKMIARTIALSQIFNTANSSGHCVLPLHDSRSRGIGQLCFDFQVIKPFGGIPLEIAHFAPYWKATSQFDSRPLITGSSLSGDYVRLFVQVTRDDVPVLFPSWTVPHCGIDLPICSLTLAQFKTIGSNAASKSNEPMSELPLTFTSLESLYQILQTSFLSLGETLALLPVEINLNLHILYPNEIEVKEKNLSAFPDPNRYVDAILNNVFHHAREIRENEAEAARSIMFSAFEPSVCTALNWKQPNYPVFFCNGLSESDLVSANYSLSDPELVKYRSVSPVSTKEAVRLAKNNNLMGLICSARLLEMVPALTHSVKAEGFVLISQVLDTAATQPHPPSLINLVDGVFLREGILRFNETIDM